MVLLVIQAVLKQKKRTLLIVLQLLTAFLCMVIGLGFLNSTQKNISKIKEFAPDNMIHLSYYQTGKFDDTKVLESENMKANISKFYESLKSSKIVDKVGTFLVDKKYSYGRQKNNEAMNLIIVDKPFLEMYDLEVIKGKSFKDIDMDFDKSNAVPVLVGSETSDQYPIGSNFELTLNKGNTQKLNVIGVLPPDMEFWGGGGTFLSGPPLMKCDNVIIIPAKDFTGFDDLELRVLYNNTIQLVDSSQKQEFSEFIKECNKLLNIPGGRIEVTSLEDEVRYIYDRNKTQIFYTISLSILLFLLSSLGLVGVILSSLIHRKREFGIRYSQGATLMHLVFLVEGEIIILYTFAGILGLLAATIISTFISDSISIYIGIQEIVVTFVVILFFSMITGILPVIKTLRQKPVNLISGD